MFFINSLSEVFEVKELFTKSSLQGAEGRPASKKTVRKVVRHPNFDENKILFATDSPWSYAKKDIEIINSLPIKESVKRKIFSENAIKLLEI